MTGGVPRAWCAVVLLFALGLGFPALAQLGGALNSGKPKDLAIERVEFGYAGLVPPEAWMPMTVFLNGGVKGFSGVMVVEYAQDDTQPARVIVPASATPGVLTPVQAVVCFPVLLGKIKVSLVNQSGSVVLETELTNVSVAGGRSSSMPLAYEECQQQLILASVGPTSASRVLSPMDPARNGPNQSWYWDDSYPLARLARCAELDPAMLPRVWAAYAGLSAMVVAPESLRGVDPRAIEAVRTWVQGGGRLVILEPGPGDAWRRWMPETAGGLFELGEVARHTPGPEIAAAVRNAVVPNPEPSNSGPNVGVWANQIPSPLLTLARPEGFDPRAASSVTGRLIRLTPLGLAEGWRTRWAPAGLEGGLIAEGPVGLGWVTVLGVDPESTAAVQSKAVTACVWGHAVANTVRGLVRQMSAQDNRRTHPYVQWNASGPDRASGASLRATLDQLATVPPVGLGAGFGVIACLLVLTLLLGPIDGIVLKRAGLRQWAWLSAFAWIALASAGAYLIPSLIRSGKTVVNRIAVADTVMDAPDALQFRDGVWTTGATGVFAGIRSTFQVAGVNPRAWWRGVAAGTGYSAARGRGFAALESVQSVGDAGYGNVPRSLSLGQWTFRTTQDSGPSPGGVGAVLGRSAGAWTADVVNLPKGGAVHGAWLALGGRIWSMAETTSDSQPGRWRGETDGSNGRAWGSAEGTVRLVFPPAIPQPEPACWLSVGMFPASTHDAALAARLESGRWGVLMLDVTGGPAEPDLGPEASYSRRQIVRLAIPLTDEHAASTMAWSDGDVPVVPRVRRLIHAPAVLWDSTPDQNASPATDEPVIGVPEDGTEPDHETTVPIDPEGRP